MATQQCFHNSTTNRRCLAVICASVLSLLIGCGSSSTSDSSTARTQQNITPQPSSPENQTQQITIEQGHLHSVFNSQFPDHPANCDNIQFLHYKPTIDNNNLDYQRNTQDADSIYFLMPGLLAGAGAFNYFAEQLILEASLKLPDNI